MDVMCAQYYGQTYWYSDRSIEVEEFFISNESHPLFAGAQEVEIKRAEKRLNVVLPEKLKALYRYSNGGFVSSKLIVPTIDSPTSSADDWRPAFSKLLFPKLPPLDELCWLYDDVKKSDPDHLSLLPPDANRYLLISRLNFDVTVLDYSTERPNVKLLNFNSEYATYPKCRFNYREFTQFDDLCFDDFLTYYQSIRRYKFTYDRTALEADRWNSKSLASYRFVDKPLSVDELFVQNNCDEIHIGADEREIEKAEKRLNVLLPEELKMVYRYRNGGTLVYRLIIPTVENPTASMSDWRPMLSKLLEPQLPSLNELMWLSDIVEKNNPEDLNSLPSQANQYLLLSIRKTEVTVLDYSTSKPTVKLLCYDRQKSDTNYPDVSFNSMLDYLNSIRLYQSQYVEQNQSKEKKTPEPDNDIVIDDTVLSAETFYTEYTDSSASAKQIIETEKRLDIILPSGLKKLYEYQDGGYVGELYVPKQLICGTDVDQWRNVFSGYNEIWSLNGLETLFDSALTFLTEEEAEEALGHCPFLPKEAKRYIVFYQYYHDTLFLDYTKSHQNPRVGVFNFEGDDKEILWFESFEQFFSALRRGRA
jgi:cell wall assembly regulator SMI1